MTDPSAKMLTTAGRGGTMLLNLIRQCADILSIAFLGIRRDSVTLEFVELVALWVFLLKLDMISRILLESALKAHSARLQRVSMISSRHLEGNLGLGCNMEFPLLVPTVQFAAESKHGSACLIAVHQCTCSESC